MVQPSSLAMARRVIKFNKLFFYDFSWQLAGQSVTALVVAFTTLFLNARLGPIDFATYVFITTLVVTTSLLWTGQGALNTSIMSANSQDFLTISANIRQAVAQAFLVSTAFTVVMYLALPVFGFNQLKLYVFVMGALALPILVAVDLLNQFFVAGGNLKLTAIAPVANSFVQITAIFVINHLVGISAETALAVFVLGTIPSLILFFSAFRKDQNSRQKLDLTNVVSSNSIQLNPQIISLIILLGALAMKSDVFITYLGLGAGQSGEYAFASRVREMVMVVGGVLTYLWVPRAVATDNEYLNSLNQRAVRYSLVATSVICAVTYCGLQVAVYFELFQIKPLSASIFLALAPGICVAVVFSIMRVTEIALANWKGLALKTSIYVLTSFIFVTLGMYFGDQIGAAFGYSAAAVAFMAINFLGQK